VVSHTHPGSGTCDDVHVQETVVEEPVACVGESPDAQFDEEGTANASGTAVTSINAGTTNLRDKTRARMHA